MYQLTWKNGKKVTYKNLREHLSYEDADKLGQQKGYGKAILIREMKSSFLERILMAIRDFKVGVFRFHYPICCVINFCIDDILKRPCCVIRWSNRTGYVECAYHIRANGGTEEIPEDQF